MEGQIDAFEHGSVPFQTHFWRCWNVLVSNLFAVKLVCFAPLNLQGLLEAEACEKHSSYKLWPMN